MKYSMKALVLGGALAMSVCAFATPLAGSISITGSDSFDATEITFTPTTGLVLGSSGDLSVGYLSSLDLTSFAYATAAGTQLFKTQSGVNPVISFTIGSLTSTAYTAPNAATNLGAAEVITGIGTFSKTGFSDTLGSFSLSTNSTGLTSFTINGTVPLAASTPEPSSLILLGTGVLGAAGMLRRRFVVKG